MRTAAALLALVALSGCFDAWDGTASARPPREPSSAEKSRILVLESKTIDRPTEVLGLVDVHEPVRTMAEALDEIREHAAKLGADAVLGVEFEHGEGGAAPTHLSGMAVRFRDLIGGRSYDVIGEIEGVAPMGEEEQADARLKERARELHADLIINLEFHHGEGEAPVRVTGRAIRFRTQ